MTRIYTELITRNLDNERFVQLVTPFRGFSDVIANLGAPAIMIDGHLCNFDIPVGFVQDFESVPIVRGSNKRGGTVHDYFCRTNSIPVVTKPQAAAAYREIMAYTYQIDDKRGEGFVNGIKDDYYDFRDWIKRWSKWAVVYVAPGYFHKHLVMATAKEIAGLEGDPYVTIDKLNALIDKTEQVSSDLKDVKVDTSDMVKKTDQVTEELKDAKKDVKDSAK
jgi:hypothetical protein